MTRWRTRHRGTHAERGAAAVEFAIVLVVLLLVIFAIIDFGRLFFVDQSLKAASREGARAGAVRAAWNTTVPAPAGSINAVVNNSASAAAALAGGGAITITPTLSDAGAISSGVAPCTQARADTNTSLTVRVSVPFSWFTPVGIFSSGINSVDASTTMRCE